MFSETLLKKVRSGEDSGRAIRRHLRFHPINEFELFFESIGLHPSEYAPLMPRSLLFLDDDKLLLENYYVLCNYGIPRDKIGRFFKEAREIFGYDFGVLSKKLRSFEEQGVRQFLVVMILTSSPRLLKESGNAEFVEAVRELDKVGFRYEWLQQHVSEGDSYDWRVIVELLCLLRKTSLSEEQLGGVIMEHRDLLLERSELAVRLFGFLSKFGFTRGDMKNVFVHLPDMPVAKFASNLCQCYEFLVKVNMKCNDIDEIVRLYPILLGSCDLRDVKNLISRLNCGRERLCQMILDDPSVLKDWVREVQVNLVPRQVIKREVRKENITMLKSKFLLKLGFKKNSKEMKKAMKIIMGESYQERFDCYVDLGLSRDEVIAMVKATPKILNVSKDLIKRKINSLLELGYSVSDLLNHPPIMCYTIERVRLRILVYQLLKPEMRFHPTRTLCTLLSCSDKAFMENQVLWHPRGLEYWERVKKEVYSDT